MQSEGVWKGKKKQQQQSKTKKETFCGLVVFVFFVFCLDFLSNVLHFLGSPTVNWDTGLKLVNRGLAPKTSRTVSVLFPHLWMQKGQRAPRL